MGVFSARVTNWTVICANLVFYGFLLGETDSLGAGPSSLSSRGMSGSQTAFIDKSIRLSWSDHKLIPSPEADGGKWCRRVFLDLIGRIPRTKELQYFLRDRSANRKAKLVNRLLYNHEYSDEYVRNWATIWTNILIGRSGGTNQDRLTSRLGMRRYLEEVFSENRGYDRMAYELVAATGANTVGHPNFNGAVNYLVAKLDDRSTQATAHTARLFLGVQVQCTQCHNHPFNEWQQKQFWQLNAFFRQTVALRRFDREMREISHVDLTDQDFAGEGGSAEGAEVYFEQRNGVLKAAYPVFLDGTTIGQSGLLNDVNRREELAKMVITSPLFSEAIVNRMWAHFLGYGFHKPIDDVGPHNPPSHPELLDYLGDEFRDHGYDLKKLMRWITLGQPYGLSSKATGRNRVDDPTKGRTARFTRFYLRQMRPEELYESLLTASNSARAEASPDVRDEERQRWVRQFVIAFGTDDQGETSTFNGTVPQTLMMFNGRLTREATTIGNGGMLWELTNNSSMSVSQKINQLFMKALSRRGNKQELVAIQQLLANSSTSPIQAYQDIWWSIINSNEFILNH